MTDAPYTGAARCVVQSIYQGFTPIGSCHFQNMANILEAYGIADAKRKICLSWGFGWSRSNGILYGGDRWIELANQAYGLDLQRREFSSWHQAARFEQHLLSGGRPFVAEVDAYELLSPYQGKEHVVHTVIVLAMDSGWITLLDCSNNPIPTGYSEAAYCRMRMSPCAGRVAPFVLYASLPSCIRGTSPADIISVFRVALDQYWTLDLATLDTYIDWAEHTSDCINVCRLAGERLYLTSLSELLGEHYPQMAAFTERFDDLTELWYLLHMLTISEGFASRPQRPRIIRLLHELRSKEVALAAEVQAALRTA